MPSKKLVLVRAIGLPVGQGIALTSKAPYDSLTALGIEESLQRAYGHAPTIWPLCNRCGRARALS